MLSSFMPTRTTTSTRNVISLIDRLARLATITGPQRPLSTPNATWRLVTNDLIADFYWRGKELSSQVPDTRV